MSAPGTLPSEGRSSAPAADGAAAEGQPLSRSYALRIAVFFSALFMVAGTKLPYLPVWLDWRGLDKAEIAVITAAPLFLRIVGGPLVAMAADWWGDRRQATVVLAAIALAGAVALAFADGFWPILVVTLVSALAAMGLMPLAEVLAMSGVRRGSLDYGRMRLWGSVSFVAIGFVAGAAIAVHGAGSVLVLLIVGSAVTLAAALLLPRDPEARGGDQARRSRGAFWRLSIGPAFLLFLLAAGAVQASHAVFYTFGVIEWRQQGLSANWAATLWAIGVAAEIALFAYSRAVVARLGPVLLIGSGALAGLLRWTVMAFDPPLAALLPLQALHGLTFGAAHLGALHFISVHVAPADAATAQALYASVTAGIGLGLATLASGPLYAAIGSQSYIAMAGLCGVAIVAAIALRKVTE